MTRVRRLSVVALALAALCPQAPLRAQPAPTDRALAQAHFDEGRALLARGAIAAACPKFVESYQLEPALGTLLNLALCHEAQGRLASAWAEFNDARKAARVSTLAFIGGAALGAAGVTLLVVSPRPERSPPVAPVEFVRQGLPGPGQPRRRTGVPRAHRRGPASALLPGLVGADLAKRRRPVTGYCRDETVLRLLRRSLGRTPSAARRARRARGRPRLSTRATSRPMRPRPHGGWPDAANDCL